jgi:hypothetical protein
MKVRRYIDEIAIYTKLLDGRNKTQYNVDEAADKALYFFLFIFFCSLSKRVHSSQYHSSGKGGSSLTHLRWN